MHSSVRYLALLAAFAPGCATKDGAPAADSGAAVVAAPSVTADLLADLTAMEKKFIDLAREIPAAKYGWRPGEGVRSVGEVYLHLASDNYLIPAALGFAPPAETGIVGGDYKTAQAFEMRKLDRDSIVAEVERSFAFVKNALNGTTPAKLGESVTLFGQPFTGQSTWILAVTHLHEHLGQMIAYARSNGVKPPWS